MKYFGIWTLFLSFLLMVQGQEIPNTGGVLRRAPAINRCCLYGWMDCCGYLFGYRYGVLPPQYPQYPPVPVNPLLTNYIA